MSSIAQQQNIFAAFDVHLQAKYYDRCTEKILNETQSLMGDHVADQYIEQLSTN
jgi:hypothetical protein